ncbi:MAG: AAA family ATPase [Acidobacteria bacterium]|nr:AAA family ATPase [Acidobacteriota bacterium]
MSNLAKLAARGDDGPPAEVVRAMLQGGLPPAQHGEGIISRCLASIEAKPINWLWPGRIARGKLTVVAGNPGLGKSQWSAWLAAIVSTGGLWPVDRMRCKPGGVIFLSAEDDPADTLRPRLEAVGTDLNRIHIIDGVRIGYRADGTLEQRGFNLQADLETLGRMLDDLGDVAAVIIDPISAYLGDTDSHNNADMRGLLTPLAEMAARFRVAVIAITHLNKAQGQQALMRVSGSLALVAAARGSFQVSADPDDKDRRLFLPAKNNIGQDQTGLAFRIESATVPSGAGPISTSRIVWETEAVVMTADDALQSSESRRANSPRESATQFLRDILASGPVPVIEVEAAAEDAGHSASTIRRAADAMGVEKRKTSARGGWTWALPSKMSKSAQDAQPLHVSTLDILDTLDTLEATKAQGVASANFQEVEL